MAKNIGNLVKVDREMNDHERSIFYSSWLYSAVHLMTSLDRPVTLAFICDRLKVSKSRATEVLDFLRQTRLVVEEGGKFKAGQNKTHLDKKSPFLKKHHSNWRLKEIEKAENLSTDEFMFSASLSLSRADFLKIKEELARASLATLETVKTSPAEDLAHLNIDLFWI